MVKAVSTTPEEKFREIVRALLEKTRAKQVNWVRSPKANPDPPATVYEVVLPRARLVLTYGMPRAEPDFISLELQDATGSTVDSCSIDDPESDPIHDVTLTAQIDPHRDWQLMRALFTEVHRAVTGWDTVLSEIEKALASKGPIGTNPEATPR